MNINRLLLFVIAAGLFTACSSGDSGSQDQQSARSSEEKTSEEVNIYTHRHYEVDEQLYDQFTEQTGIKVNVINASADELMKKMEMEGESSPADVLISVDAGRLYRAKEKALLQKVESKTLQQNVPERFRGSEDYWYGLTYRARAIVTHKERVKPGAITTYEELANPKWQDKVLIRSSENIYNQSLLASIIAHKGEDAARKWADGLVNNLARNPQGGDRDQVKAVAAGIGDVAVINTYYLGHMLNSEDQAEVKAGQQVRVIFPNQEGRGAHINLSGAGVVKTAPNKNNAVKLIEFLSSGKAQKQYTNMNYEYPVKEGVAPAPVLQSWGDFKADTLNLDMLGKLNSKAVKIADRAGWK